MNPASRNAAVNLARDLCLKLLEHRAIAPEQLGEALLLLRGAAEKLLGELDDGRGLWLLRLARDLTLKLIERNLISSARSAAQNLDENGRWLKALAARLEPELAPTALAAARDLTLKLLETGRLSRAGLPPLFEELALNLAGQPGN
jgi:hypothetical protein